MTKKIRCPICHQETIWDENPFRPFCSERCRTRDLGNWAGGKYAVPGEKLSSSEEFEEEAPSPEEKNSH